MFYFFFIHSLGVLYLVLDGGSGSLRIKALHDRIDDGLPHQVSLFHKGVKGSFNIDGRERQYILFANDRLQFTSGLFVGGKSEFSEQMPPELWSALLGFNYVGCLQDMVINNERIDLLAFAQEQEVAGVKDYCRYSGSQCNTYPCLHNGVCREGWNRFTCDCSGTGYRGPTCRLGRLQ